MDCRHCVYSEHITLLCIIVHVIRKHVTYIQGNLTRVTIIHAQSDALPADWKHIL